MGGGTKALIGVALASAAIAVVALIGALGEKAEPATAAAPHIQRPAHPTLRVVGGEKPKGGGKGKRKRPAITDLVTSSPVTVAAGSSRIVVLSCGRSQGIALDGGVIAPPPPAQVVVTMLSRANPNPPYANSRRNYYVGVRNLDPAVPASFRGSLVCAKGIDVR